MDWILRKYGNLGLKKKKMREFEINTLFGIIGFVSKLDFTLSASFFALLHFV